MVKKNMNAKNTKLNKKSKSNNDRKSKKIQDSNKTIKLSKVNNPSSIKKSLHPTNNSENNIKKDRKIKNILVKGKLSKGGMGQLYKGFHTDLEKDVVLKRIILKNEDAELRFKNEAKVLIDLHHENIVPVFDYFSSRGVYYILMDFIDGKNLREIIENSNTLPEHVVLLILHQILKGFVYFHKKGVVHRDIKPENIIISKEGVVKIVDFGIAYSESVTNEITEDNLIIGTPKYIAPEVFKGEQISEKVDIYALGIILYELLAGINPFNNLNEKQLLSQKKNGKIFPLKYFKEDTSYFFNNLVRKMVHKNPKRRPTAEKLLKIINKKVAKLKIKDEEKFLSDYFTHGINDTAISSQQTIAIDSNKLTMGSKSKFIRSVQNNFNRILIIFVIFVSLGLLYLGYNFIDNGTFNSVFHPYKYAPLRVSISTLADDKNFNNNLLIYINKKKVKNDSKYILKSGINVIEIYYRGVYIYKELNLLSFKELSDIRKSFIPSKKFLRLFKKIIINMDSLIFYKNIGENYRNKLAISKDYKYNQFVITDISRFFSTRSFVKFSTFDKFSLNDIKDFKIYIKEGNKYNLLKDGDENIYSFNLSFKITSKNYYSKTIQNLNLASSNYIYPMLDKLSGVLIFNSNIKNAKIKLNGETIGWIGREIKKLTKYGELDTKPQKFYLSSGDYYLELIYRRRIYTYGPFKILPGRITQINVKGDSNKINEIKSINR